MKKSPAVKRSKSELVVSYWKNPPDAWSAATLPHWVLGLTLAGACEQGQPDGQRFRIEKGDFSIVRANTPQRWQVLGKKTWHSIGCIFNPRPHWLTWLNWKEIAPGFMKLSLCDLKVRREIRNGFFRAYCLGKSGLPDASDFVYNAIEHVILTANRHYQLGGHSEYDPRIGRAIQYLVKNLSTPLHVGDVAAYSHLSRSRFAHVFKQQTGLGPIAFQNQQRIVRAKQMLRMSFLPVKEIALELGFKYSKYFSTYFRKTTGFSPRQYRRRCFRSNINRTDGSGNIR